MQRIGRWGRIKPEGVEDYTRLHLQMEEGLRKVHARAGIHNFTIYRRGLDLFSYLETNDWEGAVDYLSRDPLAQKWSALMCTLLDDPVPWPEMEEVFRLD
jgi:L-rhamnose mutarotase